MILGWGEAVRCSDRLSAAAQRPRHLATGENLVPKGVGTVLADPRFKHGDDDVRIVAWDRERRALVFSRRQRGNYLIPRPEKDDEQRPLSLGAVGYAMSTLVMDNFVAKGHPIRSRREIRERSSSAVEHDP